VKITPEQLAKSGTEHGHQAALFCWAAACQWPEVKWLHAIPNGGERNPIVAANMKAEGARTGIWDVFLPFPCGQHAGLYIEMKKPGRQREKNGGLSDQQVDFGEYARQHHYATAVCYTWEEAVKAIVAYLRR
jgi:hypothetical protein